METKMTKFMIYVDHCAGYNYNDCFVPLKGTTILEAMLDFEVEFDTHLNYSSVYLYKMLQKDGREKGGYKEIMVNMGRGWKPIEEISKINILESYIPIKKEYPIVKDAFNGRMA